MPADLVVPLLAAAEEFFKHVAKCSLLARFARYPSIRGEEAPEVVTELQTSLPKWRQETVIDYRVNLLRY